MVGDDIRLVRGGAQLRGDGVQKLYLEEGGSCSKYNYRI